MGKNLRGEGRERGFFWVHGYNACEKSKEASHEPSFRSGEERRQSSKPFPAALSRDAATPRFMNQGQGRIGPGGVAERRVALGFRYRRSRRDHSFLGFLVNPKPIGTRRSEGIGTFARGFGCARPSVLSVNPDGFGRECAVSVGQIPLTGKES
jgi:hypothetical protein